MATRSAIGYLLPDGSTRASYCHWDGYPEHQIPILNQYYDTTDKVKELVEPGSMSCLRTDRTWTEEIRDPQPLYHHERGDGDEPITSGTPLNTWFIEHDCEYLYVWDGKRWIQYAEATAEA